MEDADYLSGPDRFVSLHLNARQRDLKVECMREVEYAFEKEYLYKPRITEKAARLANGSAANPTAAGERLYRDAETRQVNRAVLEREVQRSQCTFQPQLAACSRSTSPTRSLAGAAAPAAAQGEGGGMNFADRLCPSNNEISEKKAKTEWLRVHYETQGCTFTPRINPMRQSMMMDMSGTGYMDNAPVYERLNRYHAAKEMRLEMLRALRDKEEKASAVFKPLINRRSKSASPRIRCGKACTPSEENGDSDRNTKRTTIQRNASTSVFERLANTHGARSASVPRGPASNATLDPECSFKPRIGPPTTKDSPVGESEHARRKPIQSRFREYEGTRTARLNQLAKRYEDEQARECTFAPRISHSPNNQGVSKTLDGGDSTTRSRDEKTQKLSGAGQGNSSTGRDTSSFLYEAGIAQRRAAYARRERTRELNELNGCTFAPRIPRPPQKKREKPVAHRLYAGAEQRKANIDRLRREQEEKVKKECTFQPKLPTYKKYSPPSVPMALDMNGEMIIGESGLPQYVYNPATGQARPYYAATYSSAAHYPGDERGPSPPPHSHHQHQHPTLHPTSYNQHQPTTPSYHESPQTRRASSPPQSSSYLPHHHQQHQQYLLPLPPPPFQPTQHVSHSTTVQPSRNTSPMPPAFAKMGPAAASSASPPSSSYHHQQQHTTQYAGSGSTTTSMYYPPTQEFMNTTSSRAIRQEQQQQEPQGGKEGEFRLMVTLAGTAAGRKARRAERRASAPLPRPPGPPPPLHLPHDPPQPQPQPPPSQPSSSLLSPSHQDQHELLEQQQQQHREPPPPSPPQAPSSHSSLSTTTSSPPRTTRSNIGGRDTSSTISPQRQQQRTNSMERNSSSPQRQQRATAAVIAAFNKARQHQQRKAMLRPVSSPPPRASSEGGHHHPPPAPPKPPRQQQQHQHQQQRASSSHVGLSHHHQQQQQQVPYATWYNQQHLSAGERIRRFHEWQKEIESRIDGLYR